LGAELMIARELDVRLDPELGSVRGSVCGSW
jgi:hypothetical protein